MFFFFCENIEMENNQLVDHSFLEVTVNSNRLMTMLDRIVKQVSDHTS